VRRPDGKTPLGRPRHRWECSKGFFIFFFLLLFFFAFFFFFFFTKGLSAEAPDAPQP
jgi:hypothetical protein